MNKTTSGVLGQCLHLCPSLSLSASHSSSDSALGLVDQLLNSHQVRDAPNILILHVTSFPFALQTQYTRISPYNEIHWPSAFSNVRLDSACDAPSHVIYTLSRPLVFAGRGPVSREDAVLRRVRAFRLDALGELAASDAPRLVL